MATDHIKRLPWYSAIGIGLGIIATLYALDMVPWLLKADAATKMEIVELEDQQNKVHKALIQRIETSDDAMGDFIGEQRKFNDKMDRRTWQILKEMK